MLAPDGVEPGAPRAAHGHVVLGMDLEPHPGGAAMQRVLVVLGLEAEPGAERGHGELLLARQALGVSEPWPFGVWMAVQVPLATLFQALPW